MKEKKEQYSGTGRRKTAVSSVYIRPGTGKVKVNDISLDSYFTLKIQRDALLAPLVKISDPSKYDLIIRVRGGGKEAQVTATRLGISRALVEENEERRQELKGLGFLTRDPRCKERKKYGLAGARKRFQFSKR